MRALRKTRAGWRANVRTLGFQGSGSFALCQITTQHQQGGACAPAPHLRPPVCENTRPYDLDQRSLENRDNKWKAEGSGSRPSPAHAHPCGHVACARVKHQWEPAGAPSPPSHSEREPSKLEQHSVTNRNGNSGCVEVLGFWIMFFPLLCMPDLGE